MSLDKSAMPRGIRNHNPGNLRKSNDPWQGLAPDQTDPDFLQFESSKWGIRALARTLISPAFKPGLPWQGRSQRYDLRWRAQSDYYRKAMGQGPGCHAGKSPRERVQIQYFGQFLIEGADLQ